jgi:hypothetical protein
MSKCVASSVVRGGRTLPAALAVTGAFTLCSGPTLAPLTYTASWD